MNIEQALKQEFDDLMATPFVHEGVQKHFSRIPEMLKKHSPYGLKIKIADFKNLAEVSETNVNHMQAGSALNMLVTQTMASLEMGIDEYVEFQAAVEDAILVLNKIVGEEKKRLENKYSKLKNVETKSGRTIDIPIAEA